MERDGRDAPRLGAVGEVGYFGSYVDDKTNRPVVFSVDKNGTERWARHFESGVASGFLLVKNALYVTMTGTGLVHALAPDDGEMLWTKSVGGKTSSVSEGMGIGRDGTLYVGVSDTAAHPHEACLVALK